MTQSPTCRLFPICDIGTHSAQDLAGALRLLRLIYLPEVRGSSRVSSRVSNCPNVLSFQSVTAEDVHVDDDLDSLRSDAFERSYAIRWLTSLISHVDPPELWKGDPTGSHFDPQQWEVIIQEAASLLAICAGAASSGTLTRVFTFSPCHVRSPIKVQVRDAPLENHEYASVGAQTWGSACVLTERIVEHPEEFGLVLRDVDMTTRQAHSLEEFRVLELGAGTGLASITLGKLLEADDAWRTKKTTIIATDFYPSVLDNLQFNIATNFPGQNQPFHQHPAVSVSSHFLDWSDLARMKELISPFDKPFDLILGADIIYETQHASWIKSCLERLLRKPLPINDDPQIGLGQSLFHLLIPYRPTHTRESNTIESVFLPQQSRMHDNSMELRILSRETIVCDAYCGEGSEVEYGYYKIGWQQQ